MTFDQTAIVVVFAAALALFISERVRYDLVALGALLAAVLLGLVAPAAAFSGFANDAVITVAAVLVMSHGLARSGAVDTVTVPLLRAATHPVALMAGLCAIGALLSSFMNNVGALALLMPIAISGARKGGYSASLLLMPLSFATLLGGTMTLVGTPPNLLIAEIAERLRGERFTMFDFLPVGGALTAAGVVFIAAIGWRLLPRGRAGAKSPTELFEIGHYVTEARLPAKSPLIGKTIREFEDASGDRAIVLGLVHGDTRLRPSSVYVLQEGDVLLLQAETEALQEYVKAGQVDLTAAAAPREPPDLPSAEASVPMPAEPETQNAKPGKTPQRPPARQMLDTAEAVVTPTSWVQGSTARTLRLRARYDANLLAISRGGRPITTRLRDVPLHAGDVLLLEAHAGDLPDVVSKLGCLPLADRKLLLSPRRVLLPFAIFGGAIALVILGVTSPAIAFVTGAVAMVVFGFVPAREVYSTVEWSVIVLLAALIPVAAALETTGTAQLAADGLVAVAGTLPPHAMLGLVLLATMALTPILNNAATVLLMGPIAHGVAENIGVDSAAFLMAVAIGASCDFLTPFGHQNNTLILGPGGYRFADFWRLGLPLDTIVLLVAVPLLPIVFPF
jgi:di/tricarboxylate transporter